MLSVPASIGDANEKITNGKLPEYAGGLEVRELY